LNSSSGAIGNLPGSLGTVTVADPGSSWGNTGTVVVGGQGTGTLTIQNGGTVTSGGGGSVGLTASSTGTVTVTGPSSNALQVSRNYVGSGGSRIVLNTVVAGDNSPSDRLVISGGSATGTSAIQVNNVGGRALGG
jgi:T5SS/PEP-CTERM-associated repeat protein